jgi:ribA/ribD-fused uncharacterized protein
MPRIGVGYGRLSWKKARAIIEAVCGDWTEALIDYEEFVPGESAKSTSSIDERTPARTSSTKAVSEGRGSRDSDKARSKAVTGADGHKDSGTMSAIHFYSVSADYGCFSNFSPHPVRLKGKTWPTTEHYFQTQKFAGSPDEEQVRLAKSSMVAARMGRSRKRPLRKDWESVKDSIMYEAVLAKFTQHADLRNTLLRTGDANIVEHTENDRYWGDGGDGSGENRLGQILMCVREELRAGATSAGD